MFMSSTVDIAAAASATSSSTPVVMSDPSTERSAKLCTTSSKSLAHWPAAFGGICVALVRAECVAPLLRAMGMTALGLPPADTLASFCDPTYDYASPANTVVVRMPMPPDESQDEDELFDVVSVFVYANVVSNAGTIPVCLASYGQDKLWSTNPDAVPVHALVKSRLKQLCKLGRREFAQPAPAAPVATAAPITGRKRKAPDTTTAANAPPSKKKRRNVAPKIPKAAYVEADNVYKQRKTSYAMQIDTSSASRRTSKTEGLRVSNPLFKAERDKGVFGSCEFFDFFRKCLLVCTPKQLSTAELSACRAIKYKTIRFEFTRATGERKLLWDIVDVTVIAEKRSAKKRTSDTVQMSLSDAMQIPELHARIRVILIVLMIANRYTHSNANPQQTTQATNKVTSISMSNGWVYATIFNRNHPVFLPSVCAKQVKAEGLVKTLIAFSGKSFERYSRNGVHPMLGPNSSFLALANRVVDFYKTHNAVAGEAGYTIPDVFSVIKNASNVDTSSSDRTASQQSQPKNETLSAPSPSAEITARTQRRRPKNTSAPAATTDQVNGAGKLRRVAQPSVPRFIYESGSDSCSDSDSGANPTVERAEIKLPPRKRIRPNDTISADSGAPRLDEDLESDGNSVVSTPLFDPQHSRVNEQVNRSAFYSYPQQPSPLPENAMLPPSPVAKEDAQLAPLTFEALIGSLPGNAHF